jgi:hypothetical protein
VGDNTILDSATSVACWPAGFTAQEVPAVATRPKASEEKGKAKMVTVVLTNFNFIKL